MKEIPLTKGYTCLVDDEDYEEISQRRWYALRSGDRVYAARSTHLKGRGMSLMHREIMKPATGLEVDHVWHRETEMLVDNRRSNLRVVTRSQNHGNRRKAKERLSVFKGVTGHKGKWQAQIQQGKQTYLGRFVCEAHAALVYDLAAVRLFGASALTNFPVPGSCHWIYGEVAA